MTLRSLFTHYLAILDERRRRRGRGKGIVQAGYSLAEILIVMAIISMLMGAAGFVGVRVLDNSRKKETRNMMRQIENALTAWQAEGGDPCPSSLADLSAKKILNKEPKDGYGRAFVMKCPGENGREIDLISFGKDGKEGTPDDIKSWEEEKEKPNP